MARGQLAEVFRQLRRAALLSDGGGMTDGQLLECYLTRQDEAAFEALVRRHGPMVLGVCRRVLGSHHDAEDALQATFLVLTRKASAIQPRDRVGNWLYGVAYRTALKARALRAKRWAKERQLVDMPAPEVDASRQELHLLLDCALQRLPEKYRELVVLCDLEGKSRRQAAQHLSCPEGTIATRLAKARHMLAQRLAYHGLELSVGSLAVMLAQDTSSASVPMLVVVSTVKAAMGFAVRQATTPSLVSVPVAALTGAVLKGMFMSNVKVGLAWLLVVGVIGLGVGTGSYRILADEKGGATKADRKEPVVRAADKAADTENGGGRLPTGGTEFKDVLVQVQEKPIGSLIFGVAVDSADQERPAAGKVEKLPTEDGT